LVLPLSVGFISTILFHPASPSSSSSVRTSSPPHPPATHTNPPAHLVTLWALQVQFLLQIIINRISILLPHLRKVTHLKIIVAVLITAINISVYCIWIPARLQISTEYENINNVWDRCEKSIYLVVDAALNWYFMKTVHEKLVANGLSKYKRLINFNLVLVFFSLSMDCLIIGMMSLRNSFV
jgi:hypothetical protein